MPVPLNPMRIDAGNHRIHYGSAVPLPGNDGPGENKSGEIGDQPSVAPSWKEQHQSSEPEEPTLRPTERAEQIAGATGAE